MRPTRPCDTIAGADVSVSECRVDSTGGAPEKAGKVDGRRAWRERNRLAVVDALLDFYAEGNLRPGAEEVAKRSGVSRRSFFRYFADRDDLDQAAFARHLERVREFVELPRIGEGPLNARIDAIVAQRMRLFTRIRGAARVARIRAPFYAVLSEALQQNLRQLGRQVERQFEPELAAMQPGERPEALAVADTLCAFETYDFLHARGLDDTAVAAALQHGLRALFQGIGHEVGA